MLKEPSLKVIRLRVTEKFKKRVYRVARLRECGLSDIAREALLNYVESEERRVKAAK